MGGVSAGFVAFKLAYQITPILLTRGIANNLGAGGILPIVALTEGANFLSGLLSGGPNIELDGFFANFYPLPGATLQSYDVATYPMANQAIAANATIAKPLNISMMMLCPARNTLGYATKLATLTALKSTLDQHGAMGGTYSVVTPAYIYADCILTNLRDVSGGDSKQVQFMWQWDFYQPLVTVQAADSALNSFMQKISGGLPLSSTTATAATGLSATNPSALISTLPGAQGITGGSGILVPQ